MTEKLSVSKKEEEILKFWQENKIFEKSVQKEAPAGNFVFFEGPPTANGKPGIHHVLARVFKDAIPRYKTMRGFHVERKAGWDTHGLPVELQVEKALKISGKPEIEKYGIKEFNQKCKESVWQYQADWEKLTERIAYWEDMEHPYVTYHNEYIESLWWIIKQIYDKDLIYLGHKVVPQCPRCGTALSSHEVAQGYKLVEENSVYLKFKITKGNDVANPGDYILAWTTTPWTLPGNVALAVGSKIIYVKAKANGENYFLAKERLEAVLGSDYEIAEELPGEKLVGLEYEPLFEIESIKNSGKKAYYVTPADFVTTADGTGVVHTAVMYGEDDYNLGEQIGLPKVHTVTEAGLFTEDLKPFGLDGKFVKNKTTEKIIIDHLKDKGFLLKEEPYKHDYPFCWRCDTPLLYYAKDSWFIKITAVKDQLIANGEKINWIPNHIKEGRFGEWLRNVKDWAISRERYWGTPLPIWKCADCGELKCIGSIAELPTKLEDLHRPFIDEITFPCACGGIMQREKVVLDCWFDSGSMPFAQYHYPFENKELIDSGQQFPAEFISEAIDQTRGWFYTLLAVSTLLDKGAPYLNVICLGHINDKFGKKMSKSKGNIIDPWEMIEQFGVDAVRMHLYTLNQPGEGKNYDQNDVRDVLRKNIMLLENVLSFYQMYADDKTKPATNSNNVLDQWIVSRLQQLVKIITEEMDQYHIYEAAREIPIFIDELSTWYLRRSRDRFKGEDEADKQSALQTTAYVILTLSKLMAPFMPFIAERVYRDLKGSAESVHLETWPEVDEKLINENILTDMYYVKIIVEEGLAARAREGIKIRQPLASFSTTLVDGLSDKYVKIIKDELNVLEVKFITVPNRVQTSKTGEIMINAMVIEKPFDTVITPELKEQGLYRELVRFINALRKNAGLTIQDRVTIYYQTDNAEVAAVFAKFAKELEKDTLATGLKNEKADLAETWQKEVNVNGAGVWLGLEKM